MVYYPNPYFNASHFQAKLAQLKAKVEEHANPNMAMIEHFGYCVVPITITKLAKELTEISLCLDSLRVGSTYRTLAGKFGMSVSEVQRILKHARPEGY